jgi:uncharacterized membrane protein YbhN (UPF0104 family)
MLFAIFIGLPAREDSWLRSLQKRSWLKPLSPFFDALHIYRNDKKIILECTLLSVLIQAMIVAILMMLAKIMNFPVIPFSDYAMAAAVTQLVNLIPASPGGIGIGEIAFANILVLLNPGVNAAFATLFLAYRVVGWITYLPAVLYYLSGFQGSPKTKLQEEA